MQALRDAVAIEKEKVSSSICPRANKVYGIALSFLILYSLLTSWYVIKRDKDAVSEQLPDVRDVLSSEQLNSTPHAASSNSRNGVLSSDHARQMERTRYPIITPVKQEDVDEFDDARRAILRNSPEDEYDEEDTSYHYSRSSGVSDDFDLFDGELLLRADEDEVLANANITGV